MQSDKRLKRKAMRELALSDPPDGTLTLMYKAAEAANIDIKPKLEGKNRKMRRKLLVEALTNAGIPIPEKTNMEKVLEDKRQKEEEMERERVREAEARGEDPYKKEKKPKVLSNTQIKKRARAAKAAEELAASFAGPQDPTFDNSADFISLDAPHANAKLTSKERKMQKKRETKEIKKLKQLQRANKGNLAKAAAESTDEPPAKKAKVEV